MSQVLAKTPRDRDTNMELLRIVSMLLVLVVHAGFRALSVPTPAEAVSAPGSTLLRFFSESASIICVNVFVLLSGWYGIRFRLSRLVEFLFQVLFFVVVGFALYSLLFGFPGFRFSVLSSLLLADRWDYWFVKCYLGLYLFAPVLNAFAERVPRSAFRLFLVSFFLFQTVYGWLMPSGAVYIEQGYSAFSFMGLYLLARYVRLHSGAFWQRNRRFDLTVYLLFVLLNTLCAFATARLGISLGTGLCFAYTNPFIILASLHFLLFFSKISFRSRLVNEVSVSCFAIYLVHSNAFLADPCYDDLILGWFRTLSTLPFLGHVVLLMAAVFVASILLDRVRILLWQPLSRKLPVPDAYR